MLAIGVRIMAIAICVVTLAAPCVALADVPPPPPRPRPVCTEQWQPVCATKNDERKTYSNRCFADADQASDIAEGACAPKN